MPRTCDRHGRTSDLLVQEPEECGAVRARRPSSPPTASQRLPIWGKPYLMELYDLLARLKEEAARVPAGVYVVGGAVRDGLLGRPFTDLDLAVPASDAEGFARGVAAALSGTVVPLGERARTWRVALPLSTSTASEMKPARRTEGVRYVDCSPMAGGIRADLARRDFTINAMALPLDALILDGSAGLIDPLDGAGDLRLGVVRTVSPDNLDADPVRLLRGVRFVAQLGFRLDPETRLAIASRANTISRVAPERVREEVCQMLAAEGTVTGLELLDEVGLLVEVLPELGACKGVEQPREHHWDVFTHQMESVAAAEVVIDRRVSPRLGDRPFLHAALENLPWHPALEGYFERPVADLTRAAVLKLAALLHDVAKPQTKSVQPDGRIRFFGHSELGAEMVVPALTRLRFSDQQVQLVGTMVEEHLRPGQWSDGALPTPRALYRYFRDLGDAAVDTIFLNLADHIAARGPELEPRRWAQHVALAQFALDTYFQQEERAAQPRLVTGYDVMRTFGLPPGPMVGDLLREVDEAWKTGAIATKDEALELAGRVLARRAPFRGPSLRLG